MNPADFAIGIAICFVLLLLVRWISRGRDPFDFDFGDTRDE